MKAEPIDEIVGNLPVNGSENRLQVLFRHGESIEIRVQHWVDFSLKTGMPVTEELLSKLKTAAQESEATEAAFRFLRIRPRTEQELERYLGKKGYTDGVCLQVRNRLRDMGMLNDRDYIRLFAEQKASQLSRMEITWKLRQRGIDSLLIDTVLQEVVPEDSEYVTALRLAEKQWRRNASKDLDARRVKVAQHLQRKGFAMDAIYAAIHKMVKKELEDEHS